MKKLLVAAAALAFAVNVNAQESAGGYGTIGGVATTTVAAGVVGVAVAAAIISNNRGSSVKIEPPKEQVCNAGDGAPVNGVCTGVQVTGTGTMTATATYTYAATLQ
ncbi:MAG: hypothetical protein KKE30_07260 [Gammaproteobacteria bacterium]|nr:hypothetical protein [Gammaproteobacteria bacterium]MBU1555788.1 hypothetical protein [Gammaproteobacteria bacterium]MBU2069686.1 hypothetical protein [Gammaproteobacteria bacterium]MBU2184551.1 hypothetical protein [Gammaproteobacteria bacterium]MBU2205233.1 hypothetical protein [Gammaproteobacteria bacterium]